VQTPPNMEAKESGSKSRPAWKPQSLAMVSITGRKIATAAVLLMKADKRPTISIITTSTSQKLTRPSRARLLPSRLTEPVLNRPADSTNMAPTVTVAGLLKPATASSGAIMPDSSMAPMMIMAVRSTGSRSVANRITAESTSPHTRMISRVMLQAPGSWFDLRYPVGWGLIVGGQVVGRYGGHIAVPQGAVVGRHDLHPGLVEMILYVGMQR